MFYDAADKTVAAGRAEGGVSNFHTAVTVGHDVALQVDMNQL